MKLRNHLLATAIASAIWALAPSVYAQEPPPDSTPDPSAQQQQDVPPESTDEAPGATEPPEEPTPGSTHEDASSGAAVTGQSPQDSAAANAPLEDKKIEQFADAYIAVQNIQQKAAADLQTAKDPQQADKVKANAESEMIAAVERTGLQVPEFNKIVERMASDNEVRTRVAAKLQERSSGT